MRTKNTIILYILPFFFSACLTMSNYGVDKMLDDTSVKASLEVLQKELIKEYNDSHRSTVLVTEVELELMRKKISRDRSRVTMDFAQQVRDEYGKRMPLFEKRIVTLVFKRSDNEVWELESTDFTIPTSEEKR